MGQLIIVGVDIPVLTSVNMGQDFYFRLNIVQSFVMNVLTMHSV